MSAVRKPISIDDVLREKKRFHENKKIKREKKELSLLDTLNEEQLRAVNAKEKNILVVASAGTGKTSTIIGRVITLLENGILPSEIILLTFTSKAGQEMLERLKKYFDEEVVEQIFAGTFHAYGMTLLKKMKIDRKIKKTKEIKLFFESIMEKAEHQEMLSDNAYSSTTILDYIGLYENTNIGESFQDWIMKKLETSKEDTSDDKVKERLQKNIESAGVYQGIYDDFCKSKKQNKICDFNDLLKMVIFYYQKNNNNLKSIIVDEYQDTNNFQNKILKLLEASGSSIFAVGDYDQSIYGFNGSNVYLVKDFAKNYGNVGIYSLCKNYRSSDKICRVANNSIENNERIIPKQLIPMKKGVFSEPEIIKARDREEQGTMIVEIIQSGEYNLNDIAILFRTNNSANLIEPVLIANNIPTVRAKSGSFFDGEDITILVSVFRILVGKEKSIMEFLMLSKFIKGLTKDECKILYELKMKYDDISGAFNEFLENIKSSNRNTKDFDISWLEEFKQLIEDTRDVNNCVTIFKLIYETKGYGYMFDNCVNKSARFSKGKDTSEVVKQIEKKHQLLLDIASSSKDIKAFLTKTTFSSKEDEEEYGVNLLTVHASKGLEFKQVFIIDLVEDQFPNHKLSSSGGGIDEERRLFYVAQTRAEEELYLCYYEFDDKNNKVLKSRFINECNIG